MKRAMWVWGAMALTGCHEPPSVPEPTVVANVRCVPVEAVSWGESRRVRGVTAPTPDRDAVVSAEVAGRLLRVPLREGDEVQPGTVVAEVEGRYLRDALVQAEAALAQARARGEAAAASVAREEHLYARGISARQALEAARSERGQADGAIAAARAQIDIARQDVERSVVRAPITGVIVHLFRRTGEVVDGTPATPVLEIADPSNLELDASATVDDLVAMAPGQAARVTFDALEGRVFEARVSVVSPAVDATTGVGRVRLALDAEGTRLPIGALGTAEVSVASPRPVRVVPASAVRSAGGARTEVVVCRDGQAAPTPVIVGERRNGVVAIETGLDGLEEPVRVVEDGAAGLAEGTTLAESP